MSDMARYYGALAAASEGDSVHYVYQTEEQNLIEKTYRNEWSLHKVLGPAKQGTSAACFFDETKVWT